MSTDRGIFVDAEGEMLPPVHVQGAQRGSPVPGGDFCPQAGAFLWTRKENVAACLSLKKVDS